MDLTSLQFQSCSHLSLGPGVGVGVWSPKFSNPGAGVPQKHKDSASMHSGLKWQRASCRFTGVEWVRRCYWRVSIKHVWQWQDNQRDRNRDGDRQTERQADRDWLCCSARFIDCCLRCKHAAAYSHNNTNIIIIIIMIIASS